MSLYRIYKLRKCSAKCACNYLVDKNKLTYLCFFTDSPRSTLTVTPDSPVFTGETVNLKCVIESYSNWRWRIDQTYGWRYDWTPEWRYEWYKGRVMLQTSVNRDTLTIRGVNESDQGRYWCRGRRNKIPSSSQDSNRINLIINGE